MKTLQEANEMELGSSYKGEANSQAIFWEQATSTKLFQWSGKKIWQFQLGVGTGVVGNETDNTVNYQNS